ncbi:amidase [Psychrobacter sp. S1-30-MNA-CIBAN-0213]|uniref:amidase n=1 Tax=Psychrobacter sp. S1-30-MNA-CIBAN-0213 TaxID=3140456 RepID=UPI003325BE8C
MNLLNISALDIARMIARKEITVVEVVEFYIHRIKKYENLDCISVLFETEAREHAKQLDKLNIATKRLSQFHGIPILLKDNLDVKGYVTKAGTVYLDQIAQESCALVRQLESLGFVILGKVKMTELAFGLSGQNPMQGTPHNPWSKQQLAPGGSSSGASVAVAAGLCPLSIGGDTGGSIRTPTALNGIFGFKPSSNRFVATGAVPLSKTLDTFGPIALRSEDIFELYALLSNTQIPQFRSNLNKLYYLAEEDFPYPLDDEVLDLWKKLLTQLTASGFVLKKWKPPTEFNFEALSDRTSMIIAYESYLYHGKDAENVHTKMWEVVRERVLRGKNISLENYQEVVAQRGSFEQIFEQSLIEEESLLLPVSPIFAVKLDAQDKNFAHVGDYTRPFNYLDSPCFSFPIGSSSTNLPVGVQLVSYRGNDHLLLEQAQAIISRLNIKPEVADI